MGMPLLTAGPDLGTRSHVGFNAVAPAGLPRPQQASIRDSGIRVGHVAIGSDPSSSQSRLELKHIGGHSSTLGGREGQNFTSIVAKVGCVLVRQFNTLSFDSMFVHSVCMVVDNMSSLISCAQNPSAAPHGGGEGPRTRAFRREPSRSTSRRNRGPQSTLG